MICLNCYDRMANSVVPDQEQFDLAGFQALLDKNLGPKLGLFLQNIRAIFTKF